MLLDLLWSIVAGFAFFNTVRIYVGGSRLFSPPFISVKNATPDEIERNRAWLHSQDWEKMSLEHEPIILEGDVRVHERFNIYQTVAFEAGIWVVPLVVAIISLAQ